MSKILFEELGIRNYKEAMGCLQRGIKGGGGNYGAGGNVDLTFTGGEESANDLASYEWMVLSGFIKDSQVVVPVLQLYT